MALDAKLTIDNRSYSVQDLDYRLSQPTDKGKPAGVTSGGQINFTVLAAQDDFTFHEWVLSLVNVKNGEFFLPITEGIEHLVMTLEFEDAYCTDLQVFYSNISEKQVYMKITISATTIYFGPGVVFKNKFLEKDK